jgi:hypothetical protein
LADHIFGRHGGVLRVRACPSAGFGERYSPGGVISEVVAPGFCSNGESTYSSFTDRTDKIEKKGKVMSGSGEKSQLQ